MKKTTTRLLFTFTDASRNWVQKRRWLIFKISSMTNDYFRESWILFPRKKTPAKQEQSCIWISTDVKLTYWQFGSVKKKKGFWNFSIDNETNDWVNIDVKNGFLLNIVRKNKELIRPNIFTWLDWLNLINMVCDRWNWRLMDDGFWLERLTNASRKKRKISKESNISLSSILIASTCLDNSSEKFATFPSKNHDQYMQRIFYSKHLKMKGFQSLLTKTNKFICHWERNIFSAIISLEKKGGGNGDIERVRYLLSIVLFIIAC